MTRELLKAHVAALINESVAVRKTSLNQCGLAAGLGHSSITNYATGKVLPSTTTWKKLMEIFCELPDLRSEIAQVMQLERQEHCAKMLTHRPDYERYDSSLYHDITPQERDAVVRRVFGCHARQVPGYDDMSAWVLVKLKKTPLAELRDNRMKVLCNLFAEARHAVGS